MNWVIEAYYWQERAATGMSNWMLNILAFISM